MTSRVLVVEDEAALRRAFARILEGAGYVVTAAADGRHAADTIARESFDVIVSDITMPGMSGTDLLRVVRDHNPDVPVVLVTANPTVESAIEAVERGAFRYLVKPVTPQHLLDAVGHAAKLSQLGAAKREAATYLEAITLRSAERATMEGSVEGAVETLWMAYQPIVDWPNRRIMAYEALVQSNEPTVPDPGVLFELAERLDKVHQVGRRVRDSVAQTMLERPAPFDVFVNLHPADLLDETLYAPESPLAKLASRIVLEITERQALDESAGIVARAARLRALGYRIAIDDLGAGYAGLTYFAKLAPDVVKIEMALVRDIDRQPIQQKLVGSLIALCKDLGMQVVAEGIETVAERTTVVGLGCELLQGFLFAAPGRPFPAVRW